MSAPIRNPRDLDDPSIYAPRWLRESPSPPLADPGAQRPERLRKMPPAANLQPAMDPSRLPREPDPSHPPHEVDQARLLRQIEEMEGDTTHHLLMHQALRPQFLPEPPAPEKDYSFVGAAVRILLVFAFVAGAVCVVIFGVLPFMQSQQTRSDATPASTRGNLQPIAPAMRLAVQDQVGRVNEALPIGISVSGSSAGAFVVIAGFASGARASAGTPSVTGEWRIPVRDLGRAVVLPPQDFVGSMNLLVDLRVNEETVADSRVVNLEWTAPVKKGSPLVEMQPAQPQQPAPLALVTPQVQPPAPVAAPTPAPVATQRVRQLDRDEIATIVKRGEELLTEGDLASARLLLQRAAEARDARAALLLGSSYDPTTFGRLGVLGFEPDLAKAKAWYKRAAEMGSPDAPARLDRLAAQENAR